MTRPIVSKWLPLLLMSAVLFSCGEKKAKTVSSETAKVSQGIPTPDFNADSAYHYTDKQVGFGPRVPNTEAHNKCASYLVNKLKSFKWEVIVQKAKVRTYDNFTLNIQNIIGSINPDAADRILLCSHWDSRPYADEDPDPANHKKPVPAANDGASGVGILLELARQLTIKNPGVGVDVVFLDAEDWGETSRTGAQNEDSWCLGTQYWAKNPHKLNYKARFGILLDMVGAEGATFMKEQSSLIYAPDVVANVWSTAAQLGFSNYFIDENGGGVTDDHIYINRILNIPTIDIIHMDRTGQHSFFEYWHTTKDDMSHIDPKTLDAVGKTLLGVVYGMKNS
ncbi:MAG: M28 family peptidase [Bacteroidota bacterium]